MLIAGGLVYDHDGDTDRPAQADILIDGNCIAAVGPGLRALHPNAPVVDARDHLVLPGFINAHYHSHDTLLKGFFEAVPVELWSVLALPPSFTRRSRRELRARTLIGAVECLHGGITTVQYMARVHPFDPADVDVVLEAYDEVGIRCIFAPHVTERSPLEDHGILARLHTRSGAMAFVRAGRATVSAGHRYRRFPRRVHRTSPQTLAAHHVRARPVLSGPAPPRHHRGAGRPQPARGAPVLHPPQRIAGGGHAGAAASLGAWRFAYPTPARLRRARAAHQPRPFRLADRCGDRADWQRGGHDGAVPGRQS